MSESELLAGSKSLQDSGEVGSASEAQYGLGSACVIDTPDTRRQPPAPLGIKRVHVRKKARHYRHGVTLEGAIKGAESGDDEDVEPKRGGAFERDDVGFGRILDRKAPVEELIGLLVQAGQLLVRVILFPGRSGPCGEPRNSARGRESTAGTALRQQALSLRRCCAA
jgi:hypothetical protein